MGAKSILDILIRASYDGKKMTDATKSLVGIKQTVGSAVAVFGAFAGAAFAVDKALDATVGKFVEYAKQVEKAKVLTGASAEETSRIIQLADDFGISYEALTKALKGANKDGVQPNIEGLAELSNQFLSIQDPVQRANFLFDTFGKEGADMEKIMRLGADGVKEWAAGIDDSLLVFDKNIQQMHEYEMSQDNLGETWERLRNQVAPPFMNLVTDLTNQFLDGQRAVEILTEQGINWAFATREQEQAAMAQAAAERERASALREGTQQTIEAQQAADELSQRYKNLIDLTLDWAKADEDAKKKMAFNNIMAKLSVDGLTTSEKEMADAVGIALGQFDESAVASAQLMEDLVAQFTDGKIGAIQFAAALNAIPENIDVTINTTVNSVGGLGGGGYNPAFGGYDQNATGGAFDAGQPMLVHRDEILVPDYGGVVLTRTDAMRLMQGGMGTGQGGGKTVNIYGSLTVIAQGSVIDVLDELS